MDELFREILGSAAGLWTLAVEFPVLSIAAVLGISALFRVMPRERTRPLRLGFFVLAPVVAGLVLAVSAFAAMASFFLVVFGPAILFDEWVATPWITMFFGIGIAPGTGLATLLGMMFLGDWLLGCV